MKLLLDTHTIIWFFESDPKLSSTAKSLIVDPDNQNYFSVASIWEIVIKQNLGKLNLSKPLDHILSHIQNNGIEIINIEAQHALKVADLPLHHRDPFDRLIIAQSLTMGYTILSKDNKFDLYSIDRLW
ncbi:MAG: type II toxin-antitoxin system VapC family toxin [Bacteroidota bacterium]